MIVRAKVHVEDVRGKGVGRNLDLNLVIVGMDDIWNSDIRPVYSII